MVQVGLEAHAEVLLEHVCAEQHNFRLVVVRNRSAKVACERNAHQRMEKRPWLPGMQETSRRVAAPMRF